MGTTAQKLQAILDSKEAIRQSINNKGVTVTTGDTLSVYASKIDSITTGSSGDTWSPPADWQDITSTVTNEVKLLVADTNLTYAFSVVTSSGTWSVDWGDGTSTTGITSNTTTQHTYTRGVGVPCSRGYTTFVISIKSDTGNVTQFYVKRHSKLTVRQQHDILWANISKLTNLTTCANMFYDATGNDVYCTQLESVILPTTWGSVTSCANMFTGCFSLCEIKLPSSWGSVYATTSMFGNCYNLKEIELPATWGSVTSSGSMFASCYSLNHITLPSSWGSITGISYMFYQCYSLQNITLPPTWGNVTSVDWVFSGCSSLQFVNLSTTFGNINNTSNMFLTCISLQYNEGMQYLGSLTQQCNFTDTFVSTQNIQGTLSFNSLMSKFRYAGTSGNNNLITGIRLTNSGSLFAGTSPQVDVSYNNLDATALNNLFNDLPTLTGKTIRITGCLGVSTCDTSIATGKGWTVNSTT